MYAAASSCCWHGRRAQAGPALPSNTYTCVAKSCGCGIVRSRAIVRGRGPMFTRQIPMRLRNALPCFASHTHPSNGQGMRPNRTKSTALIAARKKRRGGTAPTSATHVAIHKHPSRTSCVHCPTHTTVPHHYMALACTHTHVQSNPAVATSPNRRLPYRIPSLHSARAYIPQSHVLGRTHARIRTYTHAYTPVALCFI